MNGFSIPPLLMAGIALYVALYHLLIFTQRKRFRAHLTFALSCLAMGVYAVMCAGLYNATSVVEGAQWQRAQVVALAVVSIALLWFVVDYTFLRPGWGTLLLSWNPAAAGLTGRAAPEVLGQLLWQVCPGLADYRELFEQVVGGGRMVHHPREAVMTAKGMSYRDVDVFPLVANEIEGAVLRIDDVTSRVQLEDMMLQSVKMASVGRLAAGMAHEINNPLGAMMQSAQVLQMALDTGRPVTCERLLNSGVDPQRLADYLAARGVTDYLDGIRSSGERAAKIVADPLSFSRRSASKFTFHDLNGLLEQVLDLAAADYDLRRRYDFRGVQVQREFAADLPHIQCDGQQIQQVVLNLVRNAAQAMAGLQEQVAGDYQPCLVLRTLRVETEGAAGQESWLRLEVEDNGPGIPEALRPRVFEPFYTTKDVQEGTGLGLWLCWSIVVERHQGRIWVEQGSTGGARFVVELPFDGKTDRDRASDAGNVH